MNQKQLLAKRDELAQEYHLGELELYRTPQTPRELAIGLAMGGLALLVFIPLYGYLFNRQILTAPVAAGLAFFYLFVGFL